MHWWRQFAGSTAPGRRRRQREAAGQALLVLLGGFGLAYFVSELCTSFRLAAMPEGPPSLTVG